MRRDNRLRIPGCLEIAENAEKRQLARWRQCILGLVQQKDPATGRRQIVRKDRQERFAVALFVQSPAAAHGRIAVVVDVACEIEEAFRAEVEPLVDARQPRRAQCIRKPTYRPVVVAIELMVVAAAAGMKAAQRRDGFQQRRLAGPVFADEKGYGGRKFEREVVALEKSQSIEGKSVPLGLLGQKGNPLQEGGFKGAFWRIVATSSRAPCGN